MAVIGTVIFMAGIVRVTMGVEPAVWPGDCATVAEELTS
jgi:hypothetical protein